MSPRVETPLEGIGFDDHRPKMMAHWEPRSSMTVVTSGTKHDVVIASGRDA
jgi:hypothetical protein